MSWRRFQVLVRCLSPHSATVTRLTVRHEIGSRKGAAVRVTTPEAAQAAFAGIYGAAKKPA